MDLRIGKKTAEEVEALRVFCRNPGNGAPLLLPASVYESIRGPWHVSVQLQRWS